ncbi:Chromate resistance protein ChrB [Nonomuraea sp. NPDC026600]|uniref:Chromate resistance protein ChrB n=1 Tax=Nonomuraea sp. NPDC026600 TaxID=3155363 RepID=UPI0033F2AF57
MCGRAAVRGRVRPGAAPGRAVVPGHGDRHHRIRIAKFTLAELEEEEQSLERLRRWHRDLSARDVFTAPQAAQAAERLKDCERACEDYAERVFEHLHRPAAEQA